MSALQTRNHFFKKERLALKSSGGVTFFVSMSHSLALFHSFIPLLLSVNDDFFLRIELNLKPLNLVRCFAGRVNAEVGYSL